jgi:hypothetical protein
VVSGPDLPLDEPPCGMIIVGGLTKTENQINILGMTLVGLSYGTLSQSGRTRQVLYDGTSNVTCTASLI